MSKPLIDANEEVVLMWVIVPREHYDQIKLAERCYAKSVLVGPMGGLVHKMTCAHWGITIAKSIQKLAHLCCPELVGKNIVHPLDG